MDGVGKYMENLTVLVTCCGAFSAGINTIQSLRQVNERTIRIIGVDMDPFSVGFHFCDKSYIVPRGSSDSFVDKLSEICEQENVDVILPLNTEELINILKNDHRFSARIVGSDYPTLQLAADKGLLAEFLSKNIENKLAFYLPKSVEEFKRAVYELGYPDKPIVFKPRMGAGCRGFRIISDNIDKLDLYLNEKPGSPLITFHDAVTIFSNTRDFPEIIVMDYLEGDDYSVYCLAHTGNPLYIIPMKRFGLMPGMSMGGIAENNNFIINYLGKIIKLFNFHGFINIQLKYKSNMCQIYEINPRISATTIICLAAGINMPYYAIKLALEESVPIKKVNWETSLFRYAKEVFIRDGLSYQLTDTLINPLNK